MKIRQLIVAATLIFPLSVLAQPLAKLDSKQGVTEMRQPQSAVWKKVESGAEFQAKDVLRVGADSRAGVLFSDGVLLRLSEYALLEFKAKDGNKSPLKLDSGKAFFFSREPKSFPEIETPTVTASVRGTEFVVDVNKERTGIAVLDGSVDCKNQFGALLVEKGEELLAEPGKPLTKRLLVKPLDAVEWTLHLPDTLGEDSDRELFKSVSASLANGQIAKAEQDLKVIEESVTFKRLPSAEGTAQALKALILLTKNGKDAAAKLIDQVLAGSQYPNSALLVKSYVAQAEFNMDEALQSSKELLKRAPDSAFAHTRVAELALGRGDIEAAYQHASEAVRLDPNAAYSLATLGFVHLARYETDKANELFEQAVAAEPSYGLPHVGLGLALLRSGDLASGRLELEKAVFLEPNRSLYRSYLGKAYFEEEREDSSGKELGRAIELDPLDPTPYLYRAYQRLSTHRPIEALSDVEDSIALNENRAVYRSSLMLDQDAAVRSAGLAQVFRSIGFTEAARIEAIKSINKDYGNYSAHNLLAGLYGENSGTVSAQISEILLARLLSPVNFNLVLPTASSQVSFNEYSSLFDRDQVRTSFSTNVRSNDKSADTIVSNYGVFGRAAYAIEYQNVYADGFRDNDSTNEHVLYASGQYQLSQADTLLLDTNLSFFDDGDTALSYNPNFNDPDYSLDIEDFFVRGGFNHRFGARTQLIGQVLYSNAELQTYDDFSVRPYVLYYGDPATTEPSLDFLSVNQDIRYKAEGVRGDLQLIHDNEVVSVVAGSSLAGTRFNQNELGLLEDESVSLSSNAGSDQGSAREYLYSTWHLCSAADMTVGLNFSHIKFSDQPTQVPFIDGTDSRDDWNPKIGLSLYPTSSTTLRTAYFETTGSSGIREFEFIEPTLVSGFNQVFFDVLPGTRARNLGFGLDQKFAKSTYLGAEYLHRDIDQYRPTTVSSFYVDPDTFESNEIDPLLIDQESHNDEDVVRGYLYQVISETITGVAEYNWSLYDDNFNATSADTHRARVGLQHFAKSGIFVFTRATWRTQNLSGYDPEASDETNGTQDFWIVDAGVGYQFSKRHGEVTLAAENILDQDFRYIPTGLEPEPLPGIGVIARISYNF